MAKPKTKNYTTRAAIALHVAANASDPFAGKRVAAYLAKHNTKDDRNSVGDNAARVLDRKVPGECIKANDKLALYGLKLSLQMRAPKRPRIVRRPREMAVAA